MRVIRPRAMTAPERWRSLAMALGMLAVGLVAVGLILVGPRSAIATGLLTAVSALGIGIGGAWLIRVLRPDRSRDLAGRLADLLSATFDDSYTLLVSPRLPIRDTERLDGILIGPAGIRVLTARDWHGRYRVRGRAWEFDARGGSGWIRCRTNPSHDAGGLASGFTRWAAELGFHDLPIQPAIAFPMTRTHLVLEEPDDEIVTADNAPWWANRIGRVRRLDETAATALTTAVIEAVERHAHRAQMLVAGRST